MSRFKSASVHFICSALIITLAIIFIYYIWYDQIYIQITNVIQPIKLLILVDVVLGPFLTFLIFKKDKAKLKFDISIIILLQICAFIYGLYSINLGKPSLVVFRNNSFEIIANKSLDITKLNPNIQKQIGIFKKPLLAKIDNFNYKKNNSLMLQLNFVETLELQELNYFNLIPPKPELFPPLTEKLFDFIEFNKIPSAFLTKERIKLITGKSIEQINSLLSQKGYKTDQLKFVMMIYESGFYVAAADMTKQKIVMIFQ